MNIYTALFILNKEAKRLQSERNRLKYCLSNNENVKDHDLLRTLGIEGQEELDISFWFPVDARVDDIDIYCDSFKQLRYEYRDAQSEYDSLQFDLNDANYLEDATDEEIAECKSQLEFYEKIIEAYEKADEKLSIVSDNRQMIKERLRELREDLNEIYDMKGKALTLLHIPVTGVHIINGKRYKLLETEYEGQRYSFHSPMDRNEVYPLIEEKEVEYTPTLVELTGEQVEKAMQVVRSYIISYDEDFFDRRESCYDECDEYGDYYDYYEYDDYDEYEERTDYYYEY